MADTATPHTETIPTTLWQRGLRAVDKALGLPISPKLDWLFAESQIASYFAAKTTSGDNSIDAQTWKDLKLSDYRDSLSQTTSIFGQQGLHRQLRAGNPSISANAQVKNWIENPIALRTLSAQFLPLRALDTEVCTILFERDSPSLPAWVPYSALLPASFALSAFAFIFAPIGLLAVLWFVATALAIIVAQQTMSDALDTWNREAKSLREMLALISRLTANEKNIDAKDSAYLEHFQTLETRAKWINRQITRLPSVAIIPLAQEYFDYFLLSNVRHYAKSQVVIAQEKLFLQSCFEAVANLEADLAIAHHLAGDEKLEKPRYCWASRHSTSAFSFANLVHPMLPAATPLTVSVTDKSIVLTGQNGIGKSTLLKSIGLSLITHRAFGFCYADSASAPTLPIYVSLNNEDNLTTGESLYIAELRRARELLQASQATSGCICLIDEIFRGTNHLEAVAAAGAVLNRLGQHATVIVSSHHAVLAPLLAASFDPFFLQMKNDDIQTLQLLPGILADTNGIALLSKNGFDTKIETDARTVLNWIGDYLAHPTENPNIFVPKKYPEDALK